MISIKTKHCKSKEGGGGGAGGGRRRRIRKGENHGKCYWTTLSFSQVGANARLPGVEGIPQVQSVYLPMSIRAKPGHPFIQSYHLFD